MGCCYIKGSELYVAFKVPEAKPTSKDVLAFNDMGRVRRESRLHEIEFEEEKKKNAEICVDNVQQINLQEQIGDATSHRSEPNIVMKTLIFTIKDSLTLPLNTKITITSTEIDGRPYKEPNILIFGRDDYTNDYNFPSNEHIGTKQFEMFCDKEKNSYFIKDNNTFGTGLFYRIDRFIQLEHFMVLSFCRTHVLITFLQNNILELKFLEGGLKNRNYQLNPLVKKVFLIGRNKGNDIVYNEENISRIQCTFVFEEKWYLYDGSFNSPSTNGLWILASRRVEVTEGMVLKSGHTTFTANYL